MWPGLTADVDNLVCASMILSFKTALVTQHRRTMNTGFFIAVYILVYIGEVGIRATRVLLANIPV